MAKRINWNDPNTWPKDRSGFPVPDEPHHPVSSVCRCFNCMRAFPEAVGIYTRAKYQPFRRHVRYCRKKFPKGVSIKHLGWVRS